MSHTIWQAINSGNFDLLKEICETHDLDPQTPSILAEANRQRLLQCRAEYEAYLDATYPWQELKQGREEC